MQELQATWARIVSIWWLLVWRGLLGGFILGAIAGFFIGFFGALLGYSGEDIAPVTAVAGLLAGLPWGVVVVRMALKKQYRDFRIVLVSAQGGA